MSTAEVVTGNSAATRATPGRIAATAQTPAAARQSGKKTAEAKPCISQEDRFQMISEVAYYKFEQRGFMVGDDLNDWLAAEAEVDALLLEGDQAQSSR